MPLASPAKTSFTMTLSRTKFHGCSSDTTICPTVRPLPYFGACPQVGERELAASLRRDFVPLLARRLPDHHLVGQRHGAVPAFVARHKKSFPCFVRTDIAAFYPSVRHRDLVAGVQLAWRDLLGLSYVPAKFKRRYVGGLSQWCASLPLERGIPLGSTLSCVLAPLMLVPLWLEVKRRFGVPLTVYMDDVLVCCRDMGEAAEVYALIANRLSGAFDLTVQCSKTLSGRFSDTPLTFCGWRFAGGYAGVDPAKADAFRARVDAICRRSRSVPPRALVKRLNAALTAFGHYYKYGSVTRLYAELDVYVRRRLRQQADFSAVRGGNGRLTRLGLRSLKEICVGARPRSTATSGLRPLRPVRSTPCAPRTVVSVSDGDLAELCGLLRVAGDKLTELVRGQRKLLRTLEHLQEEY